MTIPDAEAAPEAANTTRPAAVAMRAAKETSARAPVRERASVSVRAGRLALWAALLVVGVGTLAPVIRFSMFEMRDAALVDADEATIKAKLAEDWPPLRSADYLETLSELGLGMSTPDPDRALAAARRAVASDPSRAFAWATIAYVEYGKAGKVTPDVLEALEKSMDACPLCSEELVRWRFNFVLSNWIFIPDTLRRRAFDNADMLRWTPGNGEFLGDMQVQAERAGLPYDAYRAAVKTPLPSWDLAPAKAAP